MTKIDNNLKDRYLGCLYGLAAGDALGATYEFKKRDSFQCDGAMVGGGPFNLKKGEWTDDTSLALCLGYSIIATKQIGGINSKDFANRLLLWLDRGYMSSNGRCFDVGGTTLNAIEKFRRTGLPLGDSHIASNGSLMRIAPVPMAFRNNPGMLDMAAQSSSVTHANKQCVDACRLHAGLIERALNGQSKDDILGPYAYFNSIPQIASISKGEYKTKSRDQIRSGSNVVDSLEAALWCFNRSSNFFHGAVLAVNLGDDTDTVAAIYGTLAGAHYGLSGIPTEWVESLARPGLLYGLAMSLLECSPK